jgi:pSer/pThr/pTyr-binding forkhead associated (FHA) protein
MKADPFMKVSLVVASGAHQGKVVPIIGPHFLIGRDPVCQLRPASQAVSKQHCALIVRGEQLYLKDFGSTNGTLLNDSIVKGEERQIQNNDSLKVGPLDFTVRIEAETRAGDGTPLPELNPAVDVAIAAVKAVAAAAPRGRSADQTPAPPAKGSKQPLSSGSGPKEVPALTPQQVELADQERAAAMLLGIDDDDVPGGTTVVDVPTIDKGEGSETVAEEGGAKPGQKKPEAKEENSSSAASDLLRKYMRRPR